LKQKQLTFEAVGIAIFLDNYLTIACRGTRDKKFLNKKPD